MSWFKKWLDKKREAIEISGEKPEIYKRGDELYFLEPKKQRVCMFTVKSIHQDMHGTKYTGEWDGVISSDYLSPTMLINHEDVHHDKYSLLVQFVDNFKFHKYT